MTDGPVFVKVNDYKQVNDLVATVKKRIIEAKHILADIDKIKKEEDAFVTRWKSHLNDVEKRTETVDGLLYKVKY